jgi:hypothetical protein
MRQAENCHISLQKRGAYIKVGLQGIEVETEVNLRSTVGQSVLVSGTHLGPATNFSFSLKFTLDSCGFVIL